VVAVEVRDDHGIDVVRVDPRSLQIRLVLAELPFGLRVSAKPEAGVDRDQLRSCVDDDRRVSMDHFVIRQELRCEIFCHRVLWCVGDIAVP